MLVCLDSDLVGAVSPPSDSDVLPSLNPTGPCSQTTLMFTSCMVHLVLGHVCTIQDTCVVYDTVYSTIQDSFVVYDTVQRW